MDNPFAHASLDQLMSQARAYFFQQVLSWAIAAQLAAIGCALLLGYTIGGRIRAWLRRQQEQYATNPEAGADLGILLDFVKVIDAFLAFLLLGIAYNIAAHFNWRSNELFAAGTFVDWPDRGANIHRQDEKPLLGQTSRDCYLGLCLSLGLSRSFQFHRPLPASFARC